jgi:hypothetical protein
MYYYSLQNKLGYNKKESKPKLYYDRRSAGTRLEPATKFSTFLKNILDSYGFVDVERPL